MAEFIAHLIVGGIGAFVAAWLHAKLDYPVTKIVAALLG